MEWVEERQPSEEAEGDSEEKDIPMLPDKLHTSLSNRFARIKARFKEFHKTLNTCFEELSIEHSSIVYRIDSSFQTFEQRQLKMYEMIRS